MTNVLTTSGAARLCGVSFRTVIRWLERGELQGYRLPGRGDYRVPVPELQRFMRAHGIPEPDALLGHSRRVLITEDDSAMAKAIERVLRRNGFETAIANDGFLAGSLLHTFKPRLLTLDIRMPAMDGLAVLRALHDNPPPFELKILVISGDIDERLEQALKLGAHSVLRKPFRNDELKSAVDRLLEE